MNDWRNLLIRFFRNETSGKEKKLVIRALHDGWADDDFLFAIESVMNEPVMEEFGSRKEAIFRMLSDRIHSQSAGQGNDKPNGIKQIIHSLASSNWIRIAAFFVLFFSIGYFARLQTGGQERKPEFHTLSVSAGQTAGLTLSDGTVVWLNSRTVMRYSDNFNGKQREVYLEGEAFFDVAHHPESPFIVHTCDCDVRALGTQFNIDAYPGDFTTALIEGSVEITPRDSAVASLVLLPNTLARLTGGKLVTESISDFTYYRWREGLISVKDMTFDNLMKKFEKCYGVQILVKNQRLEKDVYTGKFRYSDGIDYALRVLQRDVRFSFTRDEEAQIIVIK